MHNIRPDPETHNPDLESPTRITGHGRPSPHQRFLLLSGPDHHALLTLPRDAFAPFRIATYPIILSAFLTMGLTANCSLSLNLTQSQVFAAPPYEFSPSQVGFVNFALAGGAAVGLVSTRPMSD